MAMNPKDLKGTNGERVPRREPRDRGSMMSGADWHEKRRAAREATDLGYQALAAALGMPGKRRA